MPKQTIIWTLLPNGFDAIANKLKFSIFVAPRLEPDAKQKLQPFTDFLAWPDVVKKLTFRLEFGAGAVGTPPKSVIGADPVEDKEAPLSPLRWTQLFDQNTPVRLFEFDDPTTKMIFSSPTCDLLGYIKGIYKEAAKSPSQLPGLPIFKNNVPRLLGDIANAIAPKETRAKNPQDVREIRDRALSDAMSKGRTRPKTFTPGGPAEQRLIQNGGFKTKEELYFYVLERFYRRPDSKSRPREIEFDFHDMLSALADYPKLMRILGLVIDLEITPPAVMLPQSDADKKEGWMRINVSGTFSMPDTVHVLPATRYLMKKVGGKTLFIAAPKPQTTWLADGMLNLKNANDSFGTNSQSVNFALSQIDGDGAALKLANLAQTVGNLNTASSNNDIAYNTPDKAGLAALRSAGIAVIRRNHNVELAEQLSDATQKNSQLQNSQIELFADDIVRGYRVDVAEAKGGKWLPLYKRRGNYRFLKDAKNPLQIDDDGYVKSSSVSAPNEKSDEWYLHETIFSWDGWSQVAPHPGRHIVAVDKNATIDGKKVKLQGEAPQFVANKAGKNVQVEIEFAARKGTLPKLRFGSAYRLRARTVDLAGNSITDDLVGVVGNNSISDELLYGRFEPVPSPAVLLQAPVTEGESVERMVVRSNVGQSVFKQNIRHIVPPKTSQLMAETHGRFDVAFGVIKDIPPGTDPNQAEQRMADARQRAFELASLEKETLYSLEGATPIPPLGPDNPLKQFPPEPPTENNPTGDIMPAGHYVIYRADKTLKTPYLPDELARGVALRFPVGIIPTLTNLISFKLSDGAIVIKIPFSGQWPALDSFRIRLQGVATTFGKAGNPIQSWTAEWSDGERVLTISVPQAETLRLLYSCFVNAEDLNKMGIWKWTKELGLTPAQMNDLSNLAQAGSHWMMTPWRELVLAHAVQQPLKKPAFVTLDANKSEDGKPGSENGKLGRTSALLTGKMSLHVKSTSKLEVLGAWMEKNTSAGEPDHPRSAIAFEVPVEDYFDDSHALPATEKGPNGETAAPQNLQHEFGDTKHRQVNYSLRATTRFREYFAGDIWQETKDSKNIENITVTGDSITVNVKSSARPAAPKISYVVPTFTWNSRGTTARKTVSTRQGSGLRVYLSGEWYSSGEGELLAVVLANTKAIAVNEKFKTLVTHWGSDPIFKSPSPPQPIGKDHFIGGKPNDKLLSLDETTEVGFDVVGFPVLADVERKLWFCDIQFAKTDAYFPFVQLALAAYQPSSIKGAELSRVVLSDFIQLPPQRIAEVELVSAQSFNVTISGIAPPQNEFQISVEERDSSITDEILGWKALRDAKVDVSSAAKAASLLWQGMVTLPDVSRNQRRVVVKEFEKFPHEPNQPNQPNEPLRPRLVYADTIVLPTRP